MQRVGEVTEDGLAASVGDRLTNEGVLIDETCSCQSLSEGSTTPGNDLAARLILECGNFLRQLSTRDGGLRPRSYFESL